jgi:hypothetical protein
MMKIKSEVTMSIKGFLDDMGFTKSAKLISVEIKDNKVVVTAEEGK